MEKILVSACLLGDPVRYDGAAKTLHNSHLSRWQVQGRIVAFCPEIAGGFATPRLPAEIEPDFDAADVLAGRGRIRDTDGTDVTDGFLLGAQAALRAAQTAGCRHALLTDGSPSCGSGFIYSGHFDNVERGGFGVTSALLAQNGIQIWHQGTIDQLAIALSK